jgi:hypothetical protein
MTRTLRLTAPVCRAVVLLPEGLEGTAQEPSLIVVVPEDGPDQAQPWRPSPLVARTFPTSWSLRVTESFL